MPTMRSCSPSRYSVSTVSSVRQIIRLGGNIQLFLACSTYADSQGPQYHPCGSDGHRVRACSYLSEAPFYNTTDLRAVHAAQAQALQRAPISYKVFPGHASNDLNQRVDRWRSHPRCCSQGAHWDETRRDVFRDELVIERFRRSCRLIRPIVVVGEALTGLDERCFAYPVDAIEPINQSRDRSAQCRS